MGKIYCIIGKSSSGKDTIYKKLIQDKDLNLHHIVPYTTRPIREGEKEGIEYHFTDEATLQKYRDHNKLVECRAYQTIYGIWYYYTVKDDQIDLSKYSYLVPGVLRLFWSRQGIAYLCRGRGWGASNESFAAREKPERS